MKKKVLKQKKFKVLNITILEKNINDKFVSFLKENDLEILMQYNISLN